VSLVNGVIAVSPASPAAVGYGYELVPSRLKLAYYRVGMKGGIYHVSRDRGSLKYLTCDWAFLTSLRGEIGNLDASHGRQV